MTKAEKFAQEYAEKCWVPGLSKTTLKKIIRAAFISGKAEGLDEAQTALTELQN